MNNGFYTFNLHGGYWYNLPVKTERVRLDNRSRKICDTSTEYERRRPSKTTLTTLYHMGIHQELLSGLYCTAKLYPVRVQYARSAWIVEARTRKTRQHIKIQFAMYDHGITRTVLQDERQSPVYSAPKPVRNQVMHLDKYPNHAGTPFDLDKYARDKAAQVLGKKGFKYHR